MTEPTPPSSPPSSRLRSVFASLHRVRLFRLAMLGTVSALLLATCAPTGMITNPARLSDSLSSTDDAAGGDESSSPRTLRSTSERAKQPSREGDRAPTGRQGSAERAESAEAVQLDWSPVTSSLPELRIDGVTDDRNLVAELAGVAGVAHAASIRVAEVPIAVDGEVHGVHVAAVNPKRFRPLTPQATADAIEVWKRIVEGDAGFVHDVANQLKLELGKRLPAAGHTTLRVGAFASNGAPPIADAIVNRETGAELRLNMPKSVLVVTTPDASVSEVAARIEEATGFEPNVLDQPTQQRAFLSGAAAQSAFEPFSYISLGDGMIQIERGWVSEHITSATVPIFGTVRCHRLMIPQLRGALREIRAKGLAKHINPQQYGGCFTPRHVLFNPNRSISMHAWGLAVDFNVATNGYGAPPQMHPRIVEVFRKWGFNWGGTWSTPDGMHFELGALLDNPR